MKASKPCPQGIIPRLSIAISMAMLASAHFVGAASFEIQTVSQTSEWVVDYNNQRLMVYSFAPQGFKPFVKELYTLAGDNILRNSPFDHLHHHALMYAIKVNGINFWEEIAGSGVEKVIETSKPEAGSDVRGLPEVTIRQLIHWVSPTDAFLPDTTAAALLIERRTLILTVDEKSREVALRWSSQFQAGRKADEVVLSGSTYFGLGMRFQQSLDAIAAHIHSDGAPDLTETKQDVSQHKWEAVQFPVPAHPATVVIFGHPSNPAGDAHYFSMHSPFAYLSATQGLDTKPITYRQGDTFELNYLVALYPEIKTPATLNQRAEKWTAQKL